MSRDIDDINIQSTGGNSEFENMNIYGKLNYRFNNDDITMRSLNATGGITGNVTGNLTGTASNALNAAVATTAEGLTDIASIDTTGNITANKFFGDGSSLTGIEAFVTGMIILWSGASNAIPSGFVLCDGSNGTPDLRGRFVVGFSNTDSDYDVNDTGGNKTTTLSTSQLPSHSHSASTNTVTLTGSISGISESFAGFGGSASGVFTKFGGVNLGGTPGSPDPNACGGVNFNGNHSHSVTVGNTGSGSSIENRPPYYALCYIMKT